MSLLFPLEDLEADKVIMDEYIKKMGQALQSPPSRLKTSGSAYPSKIDRIVAASLLALANAQPDATTTNTLPSK